MKLITRKIYIIEGFDFETNIIQRNQNKKKKTKTIHFATEIYNPD